jgi:hypothetical protein
MIAFEALYLADDKELRYKLALRSAYLLGRSAGQRTKIFDSMSKAYALRSTTVHGSREFDEKTVESVLPVTENYLRRSIDLFLSKLAAGVTFKTLHGRLLDAAILRGSRGHLAD